MPSLIPGYEYDIFISYRQKDNRHDGWVTEFVDNLKGELESTFKEEISVYFDINPHDGLLETHDVDESLKDKLKCLIFIPIISRTYCDPKSFAWEHEFKAFVEQASQDQFGLKVKLPNGNVASRVLPIRIHDLDVADMKIFEGVTGSIMRTSDFIFKTTSGVNRPLKAKEDHPGDNLNKTYYQDQINKVSLAIKEIITSIGHHEQKAEEVSGEVFKPLSVLQKSNKTKIISGSVILLALIIVSLYFIPKLFKPKGQLEKSIAVLPFKLLSDEPDKQYLADGMMDAITLHLSKIKDLRVMPRTSVEQYRGTIKTSRQIGKELDVDYLLEGSFQKFGNDAKLIVQLIKAGEESNAWGNEYKSKWSEVFSIQSEVSQKIARELDAVISPEEKQLIEKASTANITAYDLYLKANNYRLEFSKTKELSNYHTAVNLYKDALELDSTFAKAYVGLAWAYWNRYYWESYFKEAFMDSCIVLLNKALTIDNQLEEAYLLKGQYYYQVGDIDKAVENCDNALQFNPNNYLAYQIKGAIYYNTGDIVASLDNKQKALKFVQGKSRPSVLWSLSWIYKEVGFLDKGNFYAQEKFKLDSNKIAQLYFLAYVQFANENFEEAAKIMKQRSDIDSTYLPILMFYNVSDHKEEAYLLAKKMIERNKKSGAALIQDAFQIGYAFWQMGKYKEAKDYFNLQIKYGEEIMRLKRDASQWGAAQYDLASTYCFLGDKEKAYEYLDELDKLKFYQLWFIAYVKHNPLTKSIRNEERYQKIIKNMEAKNRAEHERVRKWLEETGQL